MSAIVFNTPGLIDLKSFTHFGLNAKPNSQNPIGYFGTGLKYAIAVLCRKQIPISLYIGESEYQFSSKPGKFRDKEFQFIRMKGRHGLKSWFYTNLPYTTEYGKNWELWQVFRELYSNTIDEGGDTFVYGKDGAEAILLGGSPNETKIVVYGDAFVEEYFKRTDTFLLGGLRARTDDKQDIQVFEEPSPNIYYRGLKVYTLKDKTFLHTYNILRQMELTEDRTMKYAFYLDEYIGKHIAQSHDAKLIHRALTAGSGAWEAKLSYDMVYGEPSPVFKEIMQKLKFRNRPMNASAVGYYGRYVPDPPTLEESLCDNAINLLKGADWEGFTKMAQDYTEDFVGFFEKAKRYS